MGKEQWNAVRAEGDASAPHGRADGPAADDPEVQATIARQHAWIENFYPCSAEVNAGLGQLYTANPEFRANYDKYRPGLADFMRDAMAYSGAHPGQDLSQTPANERLTESDLACIILDHTISFPGVQRDQTIHRRRRQHRLRQDFDHRTHRRQVGLAHGFRVGGRQPVPAGVLRGHAPVVVSPAGVLPGTSRPAAPRPGEHAESAISDRSIYEDAHIFARALSTWAT